MHLLENFMANIIEKEKYFAKAKYVCVKKCLICEMWTPCYLVLAT